MNNTKRIILIIILSILVIAILSLAIWGIVGNIQAKQQAHADYSDLNSNSIVNFNQLNNKINTNINVSSGGVSEGSLYYVNVSNFFNIVSGHIYYLYGSITDLDNTVRLTMYLNDYISYSFTSESKAYIIQIDSLELTRVYKNNTNSASYTNLINIIDLTLMFGGNEPNLIEANDLFTANYYPFSNGEPMFFGRGIIDNIYNYDIYANTGNVNLSQGNGEVSYYLYEEKNYLALSSTNIPEQNEILYIFDLKTTIPAGSIITISCNDYFFRANGDLSFMPISGDYSYDKIVYKINYTSNPHAAFTYTFVNDTDFSAFYLIGNNNNYSSINPFILFNDLKIEIKTIGDIYAALQNAYDNGLAAADKSYSVGSAKYNQIYNAGYNAGYTAQTGSDGFWGFIGTSMQGITDILSIELLPNIPLGTFVLFPLLIGLIFFIVKLTKGGSD